jgi:hypothetical protein
MSGSEDIADRFDWGNDKVFLRKWQNRPTDIQKDVAGPILNTVAVLKMLRQALYEFSEEYDLRRHKKYDISPNDCLILTEYGVNELDRCLEALGNIEMIMKEYEKAAGK